MKKWMKAMAAAMAAAAVCGAFAGCGGDKKAASSSAKAASGDTVKFGFVTAYTGPAPLMARLKRKAQNWL